MKSRLGFDPDRCEYGPATAQIRAARREWGEIDGCEPFGDLAAGEASFRDHQRIAHVHQPERFPLDVQVEPVVGDWDDFARLSAAVRNPDARWDWRMTTLKRLSTEHAAQHGWRLDDQPARMPPEPGDLFLRVGNCNVWYLYVWDVASPTSELGAWYWNFARADLIDAIQWWLAAPAAQDNPFVPLVDCYRSGVYPFSVSRDRAVLFAFAP